MTLVSSLPIDQVTAPIEVTEAEARHAATILASRAPDLLDMLAPLSTVYPAPVDDAPTRRAIPLRGASAR